METKPDDWVNPQERGNSVALNGSILGPGKITGGLTKREHMAIEIFANMWGNPESIAAMINACGNGSDSLAEAAVNQADALIKALNKKKDE